MLDTHAVFDRSCLLQLSTRMWQGQKMVEPSVMERLGDAGWLKGRKHLVDPDHLAPVKAVVGKARTMLRKIALPFPIDGLTLVPKESIETIEAQLHDLQVEFWMEVGNFANRYQACREEAEVILGELFSETDYPVDIASRFGFEWRYVQLTVPGHSRVLSPEVYARERQKFMDLMETTRDEAVAALREEFAGLVSHMVDRLAVGDNGKPKVLRASMVEKLDTFISGFETRNLFEDEELEELVGMARRILSGVDVESLRHNETVKQRVQEDMTRLREAVDESIEDLPRRRILMAA
ncbi:MAG: DUF3150 domain-containing protein [Oceanidesulfovibrio sp.]